MQQPLPNDYIRFLKSNRARKPRLQQQQQQQYHRRRQQQQQQQQQQIEACVCVSTFLKYFTGIWFTF